MSGTPRVLVVCTGNICRSPMGEYLLREAFEREGLDADVDSAGVSSEESGNPMDSRAVAALRRGGYGSMPHVARRVRSGELADTDLVLAMTAGHLRTLRRWADEEGADPAQIRLWREFDPAAPSLDQGARESDLDVDDPWYGGAADFDRTLRELEAGLGGIVEHVRALR